MIVVGLGRTALGDPPVASSAEYAVQARIAHAGRRHPPRPAGILERMLGAHRCRGGRERRAGIPQAEGPQRPDDARPHGRHRDRPVRRAHRAGAVLRRPLRRGPLPPGGVRLREPDRSRASWHRSPRRPSAWARSRSSSSRRRPRACSSSRRTRRSTGSRSSARCSRATATRPRRSTPAATGSSSRTA